MPEIITKGYLLDRKDYELFDEIITFINEHGNIFSVIALGVKKILSKNSRNLFYGCLSEFDFFSSRDIDNKIGKLKKVLILENNISLNTRMPLILWNTIISKNKIKGIKVFEKTKELIEYLKTLDTNYDDILSIYILITSCDLLGHKLNLNCCRYCDSRQIITFSFLNNGFVCKEHFNNNDFKVFNDVLKILYFINNKKFEECLLFESKYKQIAIRMLVDYIKENSGINLYTYLFTSSKIA